ncbi:iron-sulfur cluster assembly scaffold protein [Spiroplasma sp. AdecLV25b]|uniref:iron-sulfur cluster assembly scaffold protein n=1 Tax=Spiroplasma sp. AdecLV25b TaxID=3027162 RepID=UPI0027E0F5E3|nr:iron-sulfur cluster assembly scaffold protein [Spiroplasma sp. AdecLV25b]
MNSFNDNQDYFRKLIVNHYSKPTNKGLIDNGNCLTYHQASKSCVDDFHVQVLIENKTVVTARFDGVGCAISTAAVDIFCNLIENKPISDIKNIISNYQAMLNSQPFNVNFIKNLVAFTNVPRQRNRIKCALLGVEGISKLLK